MIDWNADWSHTRAHWPELFKTLGLTGKPDLRFMEIGCFEGQSALALLETVLTDPTSTLVMIDPLEFSEINEEDQLVRITRHVGRYFDNGQATIYNGRSEDVLAGRNGTVWPIRSFDLIYIDGDHYPAGVMKDACAAWPILKPCGYLLFDDYVPVLGDHPGPQPAIDAFVGFFADEIACHSVVGADQYLITKGDDE